MDFMRRFMFELGCAVAGLIGIAVAAIAYGGFADVREQLGGAVELANKIDQAGSSPLGSIINSQAIDLAAAWSNLIDRQYEQVRQTAEQWNRRTPLRDDVFPKPPPNRQDAPYLFRRDYQKEFNELLALMKAGDRPTQSDVEAMTMLITQEQRVPEDQSLGLDLDVRATDYRLSSPGAGLGKGYSEPELLGKGVGMGAIAGGHAGELGGSVSFEELARSDPLLRAAIVNAKELRIYASLECFDIVESVYSSGTQPSLSDLWSAQLGLWVQEDVVRGLAEANEQRARQIEAENKQRPVELQKPIDVTTMPVKHLLGIMLSSYVRAASSGSGGGMAGAMGKPVRATAAQTGELGSSFTGRACNELYDVVQFQLELVVDSRHLLEVINAICRQNFMTPLRIDYQVLDPAQTMGEYIYGAGPVVLAKLDFEYYLFHDIYEPLMPEAAKAIRDGQVLGGMGVGPTGFGPGDYGK